MPSESNSTLQGFDFEGSFRQLLETFSSATDPRVKLNALEELVSLATLQIQTQKMPREGSSKDLDDSFNDNEETTKVQATGIPRTRVTWLQEVAANCEERRMASLSSISTYKTLSHPSYRPQNQLNNPKILSTIQRIFLDPTFRPRTFFRDLQFIAAFVPASTLDHSPAGTAFWTVGLAAMSFKSQLTAALTTAALQILAHHYSTRSHGADPSPRREPTRKDSGSEHSATTERAAFRRALSPARLAGTTLADAARLYTLAAREGDPTAARELGLFYLTHPELVPRVTLPLSKPSEVFGPAAAATGGGPAASSGASPASPGGPATMAAGEGGAASHARKTSDGEAGAAAGPRAGGLDPSTFAVAFHWMEFAANAGDADAITFFRENLELSRGW